MTSPRFIGIRDVIDPYKGLQDSVAKVGDIYRQYNKDAQEAERLRKEEARQNALLKMESERVGFEKERVGFEKERVGLEKKRAGFEDERLGMERTAHQIAVDERAEQQRIKDVTRNFDPYKTIENYGISEKFIPKLNELDQQVRDYHNKKTFDTQEEAEQARMGVENSLRALRGGAVDRDVAKRQYAEYLRRQGVPIERAVILAEASTSGYGSHAETAANLQQQAKAEDDRAIELAKIQGNLLGRVISANKASVTGGTSGGKTGSDSGIIPENFSSTEVTPAEINTAVKNLEGVIGDGFSLPLVGGPSGDATRAVNNVNYAVGEINRERTAHNEQVRLGKIQADLMPLVSFQEGVNWLTATARVGGNVEFTSPGAVKTFLEDRASQRDFSNVGELIRKQESRSGGSGTGRGGLVTGADVQAIMPQRIAVPPVEQVVLDRIKASYATMFPGAFPQAAPTTETPPSGGSADRGTGSEIGNSIIPRPPADGSSGGGEPNIIGGTRIVAPTHEQPPQPISREVLLPFNEPKTTSQVDINSAVTRLAEIQTILAGPSLGWGGKKELRQEAKTIHDSLTHLSGSDRVLETIRANARQAQLKSNQTQAAAQEEQKRRELTTREVQQIRERLAGALSPTMERINKDRLEQLLEAYPDL